MILNCRVAAKTVWPGGMGDYVTKPIRVDALEALMPAIPRAAV